MTKRILLLSSVHPATDPRILYKIVPSLSPYYEVFCALPEAAYHEGSDVQMIRLPQYKSLLSRIALAHPILLWKCLRLKPDLAHIFVPELIPIAFIFQWLGAKIVYEVQENLYKKFEIKKYNKHFFFRVLFKYFDKQARRKFFCLFTEDSYLKEYKNLLKPFAIVRNYVSLPFIDKYAVVKSSEKARIPAFFYSGVISFERSFDTLVAALVILKKKYPIFRVHLFGPVRFSDKEAREIPGYQSIREHLIFYGYTDLKLALKYAGECVAGIALLKPVADYQDSYTTKLFEYMALKLPVLTSDFPMYKKVIKKSNCGFCISPYDAASLSEKLAWIIENPGKSTDLGENGRKSVESDYNWTNEQKTLLSFYKKVLC